MDDLKWRMIASWSSLMLLDVEIHPKLKKGLGSIPFACYTFASIALPPSPLTHLSFRVYRNVMLSSFATFCVRALRCFVKIYVFSSMEVLMQRWCCYKWALNKLWILEWALESRFMVDFVGFNRWCLPIVWLEAFVWHCHWQLSIYVTILRFNLSVVDSTWFCLSKRLYYCCLHVWKSKWGKGLCFLAIEIWVYNSFACLLILVLLCQKVFASLLWV
jgi:hypothetical protein